MPKLARQGRFPLRAGMEGWRDAASSNGFSAVGLLKEAASQIWVAGEQRHYGDTEQTARCEEGRLF